MNVADQCIKLLKEELAKVDAAILAVEKLAIVRGEVPVTKKITAKPQLQLEGNSSNVV
jgi:hypothetical protein